LLAGAAGWQALHIRSTTDNRVFFGRDNPELMALDALERDYSQNNDVLVALEPKSAGIFSRDGLAAVRDLTQELWKAPFATRVDSITNYQHSVGVGDDLAIGDLVPPDFSFTVDDIAKIRDVAFSEPM